MSQRVKRPNRSDDGAIPVKRRKRPTTEEEEAASLAAAWQPRPINDLKSIYNRTTTEAPAELFRKDLISAMKLPDSEPLASDEYWIITDQWKQEWERGVQVPVNPDSLPEPSVSFARCDNGIKPSYEFKLPKNKYIRITKDHHFKPEEHTLSSAPSQSEAACSYDLDEADMAWLRLLNSERAACGLPPVSEDNLERVIERFELTCWEKIQAILRNEEGLGIEYDENVICDVCRSPDSEEGNEMVFCDSCNICVHQACYGITRIPDGQWLCCTCALSQRPECVLCPNKGGAMKCTRSGQKWAHVSCALWIPEVSIGCVEKMEPITKISSIPQSRWALICVLCRERVGACIQCSVKTCKTAYHVTCAFKHGLEMRAIIEDENADDGVKLRSYCEKHSKSGKKEKSVCSGSEDDDCKRKKRKDMTSEEKNQARALRLQEIEAEFHKHVSIKDVSVNVDNEALRYIFNYWKLKRRAGHNKPLLPPKSEDVEMLSHKQEQADIEKMKMFVQLRQDLERVRNLCYMVSRREKLSRSFFRMREQTFHKQTAVLNTEGHLPNNVVEAVIEANHGPSIYDRLYSHNDAEDHTLDFDSILSRIAGLKSDENRKPEINGLFKDVKNNPYKNLHFNNGSAKKRGSSLYGGSSLSNTSSADERPKDNKENCISSSEEDKRKSAQSRKRNNKIIERRKRLQKIEIPKIESSSEDEIKTPKSWNQLSKSRLRQVERELGVSGSESDELVPIKSSLDTNKVKAASIYSDSDSSDDSKSKMNQNRLRTKAAVKEFSPSKSPTHKKRSQSESGKKESSKKKEHDKKDYDPTELIVPQRQAAKKASENMKFTTTRVKDQPATQENEPAKPAAVASSEEKESKKKEEKPKQTEKIKSKPPKEPSKKEKPAATDIFDLEKEFDKSAVDNQEIFTYVPQRQAAKKAAQHIKSNMGKPAPAETDADKAKKEPPENEKPKKEPEKTKEPEKLEKSREPEKPRQPEKLEPEKREIRKSSSNSSVSSSSSSSGDSSSSSSSDSEPEKPKTTTTIKSEAKDRPFLDKGSESAAGSSSSESSDESRPPTPDKSRRRQPPPPESPKKVVDKKPVRKEPTRTRTPRGRPSLGDTDGRRRDLPDSKRIDVEKDRNETRTRTIAEPAEKKTGKPDKLRSPKKDAKLEDPDVFSLEKEILERKNNRESVESKLTAKASGERQLSTTEKSLKEKQQSKTTVVKKQDTEGKENVAAKKLPAKSKSIEDIFAKKLGSENLKNTASSRPKEKEIIAAAVAEELEKPKPDIEPIIPKQKHVLEPEIDSEKKPMAKQPTTFQSRSLFSPQHQNKETDLIDFGMLDDGFSISKEEETMKGPLTFNFASTQLFKEDSKEDSARETLNLVEKLRMEMSKKTSYDVEDSVSVGSSTKNDQEKADFTEQVVPNAGQVLHRDEEVHKEVPNTNVEVRVDVTLSPNIPRPFEPNITHDLKYSMPPEVPTEINKTVAPPQHANLDHTSNVQADERWVPPSDNYLHVPQETYNEPPPQMLDQLETPQAYLQNYADGQQMASLNVGEIHPDKNLSPCMSERRISQTPFTDPASMDCMPSPSPYANIHPQAKWAESEVMPIRRSSSSSTGSASSSVSCRNEQDEEPAKVMMRPSLEIPFGVIPPPYPNLEQFPPFTDASQFVNPVSLFPAPNVNAQLPFASPGAALYPPSFGAPFPSVMPLPKPVDDAVHYPSPCTAAFTSSQHNMALTAAMVNMPPVTLKDNACPEETLQNPPVVENSSPIITETSQKPIENESPAVSNEPLTSPNPSHKNNNANGKKSPSKPTRTSARFISQQKSPNKSPGKSPRQDTGAKQNSVGRGRGDAKRASGRGAQSGRGRGRGRGRPRNAPQHVESDTNTIHNKLIGTVYDLDFDDDISNENMTDLKAMRERRKSVDVHERKSELSSHILKDSSQITSPQSKTRYNSDLRSLRPPTPTNVIADQLPVLPPPEEPVRTFPDIVQPVLPGPVDMRTYNSNFDPQNYSEANLLGAFASGTAETQVHEDLDEDFEKELHSALRAKDNKKVEDPQVPELSNIKVSLSDSRNQLKVKIKGPIANYTSSTVTLPPPAVDSNAVSNSLANSVVNNAISNVAVNSGTSSLRRMRKKELLRQYWTQDMNQDEPPNTPRLPNTPTAPTINRTIITIPKAVASMTTIPTKDDYRDYRTDADDLLDSKLRKESKSRGGMSRELRRLDLFAEDEMQDRKRNLGALNATNSLSNSFDSSNKRRGRPPRPAQSVTPKLKIKIGNSLVDDRRDRIRPPKKRRTTIPMPSVEDLKRESMKFRKRVMADFTEEKKKKKDKSKKKRKSKHEVQIISNKVVNSTKLIIRFGKKSDKSDGEPKRTSGDNNNSSVAEQIAEEKPAAVAENVESGESSALRIVTPIKLKLSRCQEGVGYVMKNEVMNCDNSVNLPDPVHTSTPLPLNKDCEVR